MSLSDVIIDLGPPHSFLGAPPSQLESPGVSFHDGIHRGHQPLYSLQLPTRQAHSAETPSIKRHDWISSTWRFSLSEVLRVLASFVSLESFSLSSAIKDDHDHIAKTCWILCRDRTLSLIHLRFLKKFFTCDVWPSVVGVSLASFSLWAFLSEHLADTIISSSLLAKAEPFANC